MFDSGTIAQLFRFAADERASTAIEYCVIAAGVGAAVASAVWALGSHVKLTLYDRIAALF
ncbi:MAG: Flp family type IVb pilin [Variibacter sp.]|nr:Flp family type IVb pilin [Variibacter sp.]